MLDFALFIAIPEGLDGPILTVTFDIDAAAPPGDYPIVFDASRTTETPNISYSSLTGGTFSVLGAPTVSINQEASQADPTNASPVNFTAVFNEAVSGFATGDVTVGGTAGPTTATVTEIAPNDGTTYNVAVTGMTGDGTVTATIASDVATSVSATIGNQGVHKHRQRSYLRHDGPSGAGDCRCHGRQRHRG